MSPRARGSVKMFAGAAMAATWLWGCGSRSTLGLDPFFDELVDAGQGAPLGEGGQSMADASQRPETSTPVKEGGSSIADARPERREGGPACEASNIAIEQLRPTMTLLVDQSGSMSSHYPNPDSPGTRWSIVHDALMDPTTGVIKQLQYKLRFGIAFYTSHNGLSTGTCPIMGEVRAATNNYEAIRALYDRMTPDDDTPTGDAIVKVVEAIDSTNNHSPQSIVLVTDGLPDTCAVPDPQLGQPEAVLAAQKAHADGIDLYAMGISPEIGGQNLQQLANAGMGRPLNSVWMKDMDAAQPFQASESVARLTAQFLDILGRVPFCEVRLSRDVEVVEASQGRVVLDGRMLAYGDANGFVLKDPRHLEILGKGCEAIKASGKELDVRISCD